MKVKVTDPLIRGLILIVGEKNVLHRPDDLITYECDGYTIQKGRPRAVVFPRNTVHVSAIVRLCNQHQVAFIPRGAGTGLSGGAIPLGGEVLISLVHMKSLISVDADNQRAIVEPGHVNLKLSQAIAPRGFYYAPDPSSGSSCTIGGNVAENAGGPHCLKYGVTTNHVLGLELVLPDGEVVQTGGPVLDMPGYDLTGLVVGSEGTLGIATKAYVRILKKPQAVKTVLALFDDVGDASQAVSAIIAEGIVPAALEMMDQLAISAVEAGNYTVGYPTDLGAVLIVELDGLEAGMDRLADQIVAVCERYNIRDVRVAQSAEERALWWANRKTAFGAMGLISADYIVQDGVIPRTRLPEVLERINQISRDSGLRIANVFHAGDGNLHPLILFDARIPGETEKAIATGSAVLKVCADVGGSITGEHGVGLEKIHDMHFIFSEEELTRMEMLRSVFNPNDLCNPGKMLPQPSRCAEVKKYGKVHAH